MNHPPPEAETMAKNDNGFIKKIVAGVLIVVIGLWIAWVCEGIVTGKSERAVASTERIYIGKNIDEIKRGITDLKKHFKVP